MGVAGRAQPDRRGRWAAYDERAPKVGYPLARHVRRRAASTSPGSVRFQLDLDHELGQGEPFDLEPGSVGNSFVQIVLR